MQADLWINGEGWAHSDKATIVRITCRARDGVPLRLFDKEIGTQWRALHS